MSMFGIFSSTSITDSVEKAETRKRNVCSISITLKKKKEITELSLNKKFFLTNDILISVN